MNVPTKHQLYEQIRTLQHLNQKIIEEQEQEKVRRWEKHLPQAFEECRKQLLAIFPNLLTMLKYEHVDEGGYWFTFHLINDSRVQTYAVRHGDLAGGI